MNATPITLPDLTPRGYQEIDLLGKMTAAEWKPGLGCYAVRLCAPTTMAGVDAIKESDRFTRSLKTIAAAREACRALLPTDDPRASLSLRELHQRIAFELWARWFPEQIINASPA